MSNIVMETNIALTPSDYILSHLRNLNNIGAKQESIIDFNVINWDTLFWSVLCGLITLLILWLCTKKMTVGIPSRFQAAIEMLVEMVDDQAKATIHGDRRFVAPLALTVFIWIVLMNTVDLIPVDWVHGVNLILGVFHIHLPHHRAVATADLNSTLGMSCAVLLLMFYYGIKIKGIVHFTQELFSAPFGAKWFLAPVNLLLNIIEYAAKGVSLGMRLFGNMYAGELVFLLIALLGAVWHFDPEIKGILSFIGHIIAGTIWAVFHILVVLLQAFIFMMLTLIYIGQAHESH